MKLKKKTTTIWFKLYKLEVEKSYILIRILLIVFFFRDWRVRQINVHQTDANYPRSRIFRRRQTSTHPISVSERVYGHTGEYYGSWKYLNQAIRKITIWLGTPSYSEESESSLSLTSEWSLFLTLTKFDLNRSVPLKTTQLVRNLT